MIGVGHIEGRSRPSVYLVHYSSPGNAMSCIAYIPPQGAHFHHAGFGLRGGPVNDFSNTYPSPYPVRYVIPIEIKLLARLVYIGCENKFSHSFSLLVFLVRTIRLMEEVGNRRSGALLAKTCQIIEIAFFDIDIEYVKTAFGIGESPCGVHIPFHPYPWYKIPYSLILCENCLLRSAWRHILEESSEGSCLGGKRVLLQEYMAKIYILQNSLSWARRTFERKLKLYVWGLWE